MSRLTDDVLRRIYGAEPEEPTTEEAPTNTLVPRPTQKANSEAPVTGYDPMSFLGTMGEYMRSAYDYVFDSNTGITPDRSSIYDEAFEDYVFEGESSTSDFLPPAPAPKYTVQSGDNLTRIAKEYGVTVEELAKTNAITDPNAIAVGQELKVPTGSEEPAAEPRVAPPEIMPLPAQSYDLAEPPEDAYAPAAPGYRESRIKSHSYYRQPLAEGGIRGNSRRGGDASKDVQRRAMEAIVRQGKEAGLSKSQIALTLAIARHESGFNPDAAAGTTSAHGLGQFINKTGTAYGLTDDNRWDLDAQASALVAHTKDNIALAQKRNQGIEYVYKYHHDGPTKDYGGLQTAKDKVLPFVSLYENMLDSEEL